MSSFSPTRYPHEFLSMLNNLELVYDSIQTLFDLQKQMKDFDNNQALVLHQNLESALNTIRHLLQPLFIQFTCLNSVIDDYNIDLPTVADCAVGLIDIEMVSKEMNGELGPQHIPDLRQLVHPYSSNSVAFQQNSTRALPADRLQTYLHQLVTEYANNIRPRMRQRALQPAQDQLSTSFRVPFNDLSTTHSKSIQFESPFAPILDGDQSSSSRLNKIPFLDMKPAVVWLYIQYVNTIVSVINLLMTSINTLSSNPKRPTLTSLASLQSSVQQIVFYPAILRNNGLNYSAMWRILQTNHNPEQPQQTHRNQMINNFLNTFITSTQIKIPLSIDLESLPSSARMMTSVHFTFVSSHILPAIIESISRSVVKVLDSPQPVFTDNGLLSTIKMGSFISCTILTTLLSNLLTRDSEILPDDIIVVNTVLKFIEMSSAKLDEVLWSRNQHYDRYNENSTSYLYSPNTLSNNLHQYLPPSLIQCVISASVILNDTDLFYNLLTLIQFITTLRAHQSFYYTTLTFPYSTFTSLALGTVSTERDYSQRYGDFGPRSDGFGPAFGLPNDHLLQVIVNTLYNLTIPANNETTAILYLMTKGGLPHIVQSITSVIYNVVLAWVGHYRAVCQHLQTVRAAIETFKMDMSTLILTMLHLTSFSDSSETTSRTLCFETELYRLSCVFLTQLNDVSGSYKSQWRVNPAVSISPGYFIFDRDSCAPNHTHSISPNPDSTPFQTSTNHDQHTTDLHLLSERINLLWKTNTWGLGTGEAFCSPDDAVERFQDMKQSFLSALQQIYIEFNPPQESPTSLKSPQHTDGGIATSTEHAREKKQQRLEQMEHSLDHLTSFLLDTITALPNRINSFLNPSESDSIPEHLSLVPQLLSLLFNNWSSVATFPFDSFVSPPPYNTPVFYPTISLSLQNNYATTLSKLLSLYPWEYQARLHPMTFDSLAQLHHIGPIPSPSSPTDYHSIAYPLSTDHIQPLSLIEQLSDDIPLPRILDGVVLYLDFFKIMLCHASLEKNTRSDHPSSTASQDLDRYPHTASFCSEDSLFNYLYDDFGTLGLTNSTEFQHSVFQSVPACVLESSYMLYVNVLVRTIHGFAHSLFYSSPNLVNHDRSANRDSNLTDSDDLTLFNQWTYNLCSPRAFILRSTQSKHPLPDDGSLFQANQLRQLAFPLREHNSQPILCHIVDSNGDDYITVSSLDDDSDDDCSLLPLTTIEHRSRKEWCLDEYDFHQFRLSHFGLNQALPPVLTLNNKCSFEIPPCNRNTDSQSPIPFAFDDVTAGLQHCIELFLDLLIRPETWAIVSLVELGVKNNNSSSSSSINTEETSQLNNLRSGQLHDQSSTVSGITQDDIVILEQSSAIFELGLTNSDLIQDSVERSPLGGHSRSVWNNWDFCTFRHHLRLLNLGHLTKFIPESVWTSIFLDHTPEHPTLGSSKTILEQRRLRLQAFKSQFHPAHVPAIPPLINNVCNSLSFQSCFRKQLKNNRQAPAITLPNRSYLTQPSQGHLSFFFANQNQQSLNALTSAFSHQHLFPSTRQLIGSTVIAAAATTTTTTTTSDILQELPPNQCSAIENVQLPPCPSLNIYNDPTYELDLNSLINTIQILSKEMPTVNSSTHHEAYAITLHSAICDSTRSHPFFRLLDLWSDGLIKRTPLSPDHKLHFKQKLQALLDAEEQGCTNESTAIEPNSAPDYHTQADCTHSAISMSLDIALLLAEVDNGTRHQP